VSLFKHNGIRDAVRGIRDQIGLLTPLEIVVPVLPSRDDRATLQCLALDWVVDPYMPPDLWWIRVKEENP
jgi:hypothetical protein